MIDALPTCAEFDYGQYEPKLADELRQAAERIRSRGQDQIAAIVDIGDQLNQVKSKVGHGNWGSWLNSETAMSVATANRYMRGAAFVADKRAQGKFVTVTNLTPGLLFQMSAKSAPPLLVHEAVERAETNAPMSEKEFRSRLAALKEAKRTARIGAATEAAQDQEHPHSAPEHGGRPQTFGREQEAANAAVLMLRESLGDQFPTFVALVEEAGGAFSSALRGSAILPTTIPIASTTEVNLQPTAAGAEPPTPKPGEHGCPEFLDQVTPTVLCVSEPQPEQGDKQIRPEVHKVQEFREPSAEASVRELGMQHEDRPRKTLLDRPEAPISPEHLQRATGETGFPADPQPIPDRLEEAYQAMSAEDRAGDRDWVMRRLLHGDRPAHPSSFLTRYLDATAAEQRAFRSRRVAEPIQRAA